MLRICKQDLLQNKAHESSDYDEIEVMLFKDFKEKVLNDIFGPERLLSLKDKLDRFDELLKKCGAILVGKNTISAKEQLLNFHILAACLKIHGHDCNKEEVDALG